MGTNYYLHDKEGEELHIGKSSMGWCFLLRVHPEEGINSLKDWKPHLQDPNSKITNEYGDEVEYDFLIDIITNRRGVQTYLRPLSFHYLERNYAEQGPRGLLRNIVDNDFCVGHGPGPYDYIAREFS